MKAMTHSWVLKKQHEIRTLPFILPLMRFGNTESFGKTLGSLHL